jgi:hypothetical protein
LKFNKNIPYPHTHTPKAVGVGVVTTSFKSRGEEGRTGGRGETGGAPCDYIMGALTTFLFILMEPY